MNGEQTSARRRLATCLAASPLVTAPQGITEVLAEGDVDVGGHVFLQPRDVVVDGAGNAYVSGQGSDNVFRIAPDGTLTQVLDASGDGQGNTMDEPIGVHVDDAGNLYVAAWGSSNAFRRAPDGTITELIDETGDGQFYPLWGAYDVDVDGLGNVYVLGWGSNNAFRIEPNGTITQILDASGDGVHALDGPIRILARPDGVVYVSGYWSSNVYRVDLANHVEQVIDSTGDGFQQLYFANGLAMDASGFLYVGSGMEEVFGVSPSGEVSVVLGFFGDGQGNWVGAPLGVDTDPFGNLHVASYASDRVFRKTSTGHVDMIMNASGDGQGNTLEEPFMLSRAPDGSVYVVGWRSRNVFKIDGCGEVFATATVRNGTGANPLAYTEATPAVLGTYWNTAVDLGGAVASLVKISVEGPWPGIPTLFGEVLCAPPFAHTDVAAGAHAVTIPFDCSLLGQSLWTQAARIRLSPFQLELTNALDVTIGTTD